MIYFDKMMRPVSRGVKIAEKKIAQGLMGYAIRKNPEYFKACVAEVAADAAKKIIRDEMVRMRIAKCSIEGCLKRTTLMKYGDALVCVDHHRLLTKKREAA